MVAGWFWVVLANVEGVREPRIVPYDPWAHNFEVCMTQRLPQLESGVKNGPIGCPGGPKSQIRVVSENAKKSKNQDQFFGNSLLETRVA